MRAAPSPVIVVGQNGDLLERNKTTDLVFIAVRPGVALDDEVASWLAEVQRANARQPVRGQIARRSSPAPATPPDDAMAWWLLDETMEQRTTRLLEVERERTAFLARASTLLLSSMNLGRCMEVTAQLAAECLGDAAVVIHPPKGTTLTTVTCVRGGQVVRDTVAADLASIPGLDVALTWFPPAPLHRTDPATVPDWIVPAGLGPIGSAVVVPLRGQGMPSGALVLLRKSTRAVFSENAETFVQLFAAHAGAAMATARLHTEQASITEILTRDLVPPQLHEVDGIEFAGGYQPSATTERVGGDFYDLHPAGTAGHESFLVLGDVCGKGLEAAVVTGKIRNTLHALLPLAHNHQRILTMLNSALLGSHHTRFATLVFASAVREGPDVRLRLTNAGHLPPLIVRNDGTVDEARTRGRLVGVLPTVHANTTVVRLAPGESCLLYTDGITEAKGGPLGEAYFGEQRLKDVLSECAGIPGEAIVERVHMLAAEWIGDNQHDDIAVLAITAPRHQDTR
ncbi:serine phosphatase RsbU (regulator of sigma subunit) [Kutzneria buriramensis]|uniref:Serine phosphatase RsbU (Regulator of sigma subunit) n=2 Tax=Kutzneria buriramensis TaxID=1045776 RepID=A0A3E0GVX5_9PSEU|nr:serine phosphatase RsbU (regulator of sigma subunit) [Kutzneria buriramensis]